MVISSTSRRIDPLAGGEGGGRRNNLDEDCNFCLSFLLLILFIWGFASCFSLVRFFGVRFLFYFFSVLFPCFFFFRFLFLSISSLFFFFLSSFLFNFYLFSFSSFLFFRFVFILHFVFISSFLQLLPLFRLLFLPSAFTS